jgi:hypothetical protein
VTAPDATLGGYLQKHSRPPSFDGSDGAAYSVEIYVTEDPDDDHAFGGALLFVRWSDDGTLPVGHLETDYLAYGDRRSDVRAQLQRLTLYEVKDHLDRLIAAREEPLDW